MTEILQAIRILDFSQMKTGPMGTQLLADLGADVVKVERAGSGDWERQFPAFGRMTEQGASTFFLAMNRNKRSLAVDMKAPEAREILYALAAESDVVVQNFRPGVMERLGLGYEDLKKVKPDIIYCSISGYGRSGPYVSRPGQDLLAQAVSGLILQNGTADRPMPVASTVADGVTAFLVALAVLGALVHRLRTGEGQEVEVDLMSTLVALQQEEVSAFLNLHPRPSFARSASGIAAPWLSAPYGIYLTRDGSYLAMAMNPLDQLAGLLEVPELAQYADPTPAFAQRDAVKRLIEERIRQEPLGYWIERLLAADIWCAPVNDLAGMVEDPQARHNELIQTMSHPAWGTIQIVAAPVRYSETPATYRTPPPLVGEHSREILREAGRSDSEIDDLFARGIITEAM